MILSPDQLTGDEHAVAIGLFVEDDHHIVGKTRMPRHPTRFRGTPAELTNHSPAWASTPTRSSPSSAAPTTSRRSGKPASSRNPIRNLRR